MTIPLIPLEDGRFQFVPLPGRHDPTEDERAAAAKADLLTRSALLKEQGWSPADLETAMTFGLPKPTGRTQPRFRVLSGGVDVGEPVYSRVQIAEFLARLLTFAARVRR